MLKALDLISHDPFEPIYTFIDPVTGKNTNIASRLLHNWCAEHHTELETVLIETNADIVRKFKEDNSISAAHCGSLMADYMLGTREFEPIIFAAEGPNFSVPVSEGGDLAMLVDGHHRYVVTWIAGVKGIDLFKGYNYLPGHVPSLILQPRQWHPFLIEGCEEINSDQLRDIPLMKSKL